MKWQYAKEFENLAENNWSGNGGHKYIAEKKQYINAAYTAFSQFAEEDLKEEEKHMMYEQYCSEETRYSRVQAEAEEAAA